MEVAMSLLFQRVYMASLPSGTPVFSLRECVTKCYYQRNCSSLFYDINSKTCQLTTELFEETTLGKTTRDVDYFVWTRDDCDNGFTWRRDLDLCYKLNKSRKTWADANKTCHQYDSHLVKVNSAGIKGLITKISRRSGESIWLGASAPKRFYNWTWTDGSGLDVVFWDKDEPDHNLPEHCQGKPKILRHSGLTTSMQVRFWQDLRMDGFTGDSVKH
ncbi:secretory phospholipase A2 receptor-like [Haliotis rubra]|uniref:secretory phospholipase A2 receptor-like n=1 Tax=Haliotis rubra TaxID=36100 RepID=UPI001EE55C55|nr:secretory phospholipase A2 receptor-like [Haliotis rubra]